MHHSQSSKQERSSPATSQARPVTVDERLSELRGLKKSLRAESREVAKRLKAEGRRKKRLVRAARELSQEDLAVLAVQASARSASARP